ncbi:MAG: transcription antitermination factor NusB [Myxococcota bacterium]
MGRPGRQRKAREAALQVLFAVDVSERIEPLCVERTFEGIIREFALPARSRQRALDLVLGVARNLKRIDEGLSEASRHWKLYRLATVDRNILRIATYELLFEPDTPTEVILDEAIEIARRFASDSSPSFVNGVLDAVARSCRGSSQ